jgi:hypothetical protein
MVAIKKDIIICFLNLNFGNSSEKNKNKYDSLMKYNIINLASM